MLIQRWPWSHGRRGRFLICWAIMAATLMGTQFAATLIVAAAIHPRVFHGPPLWVFGLDIIGATLPAAVQSRAGRVTS